MIKSVIFDCFGVLTTDGWKQLREEFFSHDQDKMQHAIDMDKAVNAGFTDYDDFINEICHMSGLREDEVRKRMNGAAPNKMLFEYIRNELKPSYKIGMLSNAADDWLDKMFEPWQTSLFDRVTLSYEVGAAKPDTLIYQTAIARLDMRYEDCLYIDDSEQYVVAARDLGMSGIHHTDTRETIEKIKEHLNA